MKNPVDQLEIRKTAITQYEFRITARSTAKTAHTHTRRDRLGRRIVTDEVCGCSELLKEEQQGRSVVDYLSLSLSGVA